MGVLCLYYSLNTFIIGLTAKTKLATKNQAQCVLVTQFANPGKIETKNKVANKTDDLIKLTSQKPKFLKFIFITPF